MRKYRLFVIVVFFSFNLTWTAWGNSSQFLVPLYGENNSPLFHVITVGKNNADFTDPAEAANSIFPSIQLPVLIVIGPGEYHLSQPLVMKPYMKIVGSGQELTKLTGPICGGSEASSALVYGADNSALSDLTLENKGCFDYATAIYNSSCSPHLERITVIAESTYNGCAIVNIHSSPEIREIDISVGGDPAYGFRNILSVPIIENTSIEWISGVYKFYGVYNEYSSPVMAQVKITQLFDVMHSFGVYNYFSDPELTDFLIKTHSTQNTYGIYNDHSNPVIRNTFIRVESGGGNDHCGIYNESSSPVISNVQVSGYGTEGHTDSGVGVLNRNSAPRIEHSSLEGGEVGVKFIESNSGARILNTRIIGGVSDDPAGVQCQDNYDDELNDVGC